MAFVDINVVPLCDLEGVSKGAGKEISDGQRRNRRWVKKIEFTDGGPFPVECGHADLDASKILRALYYLAADFWRVRIPPPTGQK